MVLKENVMVISAEHFISVRFRKLQVDTVS